MTISPPPPSSPWQLLYGGAHRLRERWYRGRAARLPCPVVSVGNLHWGGGGKTPLVAALARHLRDRGLSVCVLSRGYGGARGEGRGDGARVVSAGTGPLLGPAAAGDEPVLLAEELPGVAVVVGRDRWRAGRLALERLRPAPALFLLDDGFSHLALARDLDLLAFPAGDPFAGGRLLPGGRLREPLAAVARASAVVLTGAPCGDVTRGEPSSGAESGPGRGLPQNGADLAAALRAHGFRGAGFSSATRAGTPALTGGRPLAAGSRVLAVAGIARPQDFFAAVRRLDFAVMAELRFPDHHPYPPASLARIEAAARASGAACVLVTGKDRVKLAGRLDVPLAALPVAAVPEPSFWAWFDRALEPLLALPPAGSPRP